MVGKETRRSIWTENFDPGIPAHWAIYLNEAIWEPIGSAQIQQFGPEFPSPNIVPILCNYQIPTKAQCLSPPSYIK